MLDSAAAAPGPAGKTWELSLPLSEFWPLQPRLTFAPMGLEITDAYALAIHENAGLEIPHLAPRPGSP